MKFAILGAGSWGIANAVLLHGNGHDVCVWSHSEEEVDQLNRDKESKAKLPGVPIPESITIHSDLQASVSDADCIVFGVPSTAIRPVARQLKDLKEGVLFLSLAKGIENDTLLRMSEIIIKEVECANPQNTLVLSGPSHAEEVAKGIPTSVVIAGAYLNKVSMLQEAYSNEFFRVYTSDDVLGVELCGCLKNVIAIATGICDGLGFGDNTKGALLARGLAEISRLGEKMGGQSRTFSGLSGMGDLITTCFSRHSRNRYVGEEIGKGRVLKDILAQMTMVAEGVKATKSGLMLSRKHDVEMPITKVVYDVLYNDEDPKTMVSGLMTRELKSEGL